MADNSNTRPLDRQPLAIVGIGCRFPGGVTSPEQFWQLLVNGVDAISEVPEDRFSLDKYFHEDAKRPGRLYARWGGFVEAIDGFDAAFFNISPREASRMDPQQRIVMEVSYSALEDAGEAVDKLAGSRTGVYVGISTYDYGGLQGQPSEQRLVDSYTNLGGSLSITAARVSYAFDLKGPSLAVDTACSSSLVAMHLACRSLWSAESDMVLVAGVNYLLSHTQTMGFCKASMLSPDGRCKPFDSRANGYVRAEGCGVVVLKPLDRALADGNPIYATVRATAVNQDGRSSSIAVPNRLAQQELLEETYRSAGIDPTHVHYVEAHGTGTPVGDPVEAAAIGHVLGEGRAADEPCLIGSVKSNFGHLEAGSGTAGVIKVALSMKYGAIPPTLHYLEPNPDIDFDGLGLQVVDALRPWPETKTPKIAGINSFGFGGTNAHVVLEQAPEVEEPTAESDDGRASLLCLSARSTEALEALAESYRGFLSDPESGGGTALARVCRSAFHGRSHHELRLAVAAPSRQEMAEHLGAFAAGEKRLTMVSGRRLEAVEPKVAFVFSGMGPQWWAMGRELLAEEPVFRDAVTECSALLAEHVDCSLLEELGAEESQSRVQETRIAQPTIFALQIGLARLWRSWGVEPSAIVGHSVGEVAAAHVAGALSLQDAVAVIHHRSRLQHTTEGQGRMLAVGLPADEAEPLLSRHEDLVGIAAVNSPGGVTLSGSAAALEEIDESLKARGVFSRFLQVAVPYHSPKMDPLRDELVASLGELQPRSASVPLFSTPLGHRIDGRELTAEYWWQNVRSPVLFSAAMTALLEAGSTVFLEISAHPVLSAVMAECLVGTGSKSRLRHSLRRHEPERATMLANLGGLHADGYDIDWDRSGTCSASFVKLPGYPWQHEHLWSESEVSRRSRIEHADHPHLGERLSTAQRAWSVIVDPGEPSYLEDHRFRGAVLYPAAAYLDMALAAAREALGEGPIVLEEVDILKALMLRRDEAVELQLNLEDDTSSFSIHSRPAGSTGSWDLHVTGHLRLSTIADSPAGEAMFSPDSLSEIPVSEYYDRYEAAGLEFGPAFRRIEKLWGSDSETQAEICDLRQGEHSNGAVFHPPTLDACLQVAAGARIFESETLYLPVHVKRLKLFSSPRGRLQARAVLPKREDGPLECDIEVRSDTAGRIAEISGFRGRPVARKSSAEPTMRDHLFRYRWSHRLPKGPRPEARLESTAGLLGALEARLQRWSEELGRAHHHEEVIPRLDAWFRTQLAHQMRSSDWPSDEEINDSLRALLDRLRQLAGDAHLPTDTDRSPSEWVDLLAAHPAYVAELVLLRRFATSLGRWLRGELTASEILCPHGDSAAVEHLLEDAPTSRLHNMVLGEALRIVARSCPTDRSLRILGLGVDARRVVMPALPLADAAHVEIVIASALEEDPAVGAIDGSELPIVFRHFDPREPLAEQEFEDGSFDLIFLPEGAATAAPTPGSAACIRTLLAPGGVLLALEPPHLPPGLDLPLAPLFASNSDLAASGAEAPLTALSEAALEAAGFTDVTSLCENPQRLEPILFLARNATTGPSPGPTGIERLPLVEAVSEPGSWLVFCDDTVMSDELTAALRTRGLAPILVEAGDCFERFEDGGFKVRPADPDDMQRLIEEVLAGDPPCCGVVHLWSLSTTVEDSEADAEWLAAAQDLCCTSALHLAQALGRSKAPAPRLHLVTRGAEAVAGGGVTSPVAGELWGLGRVLMNEQPGLGTRLIDLDPSPGPREAERLTQELLANEDEAEVALRPGGAWVHRLEPARFWRERPTWAEADRGEGRNQHCVQLRVGVPGILDTLAFESVPRLPPGPGQIEARVQAAALNFKDVAKAMGLLGDSTLEGTASGRGLGLECAGTVTAIGEGVTNLQPGDDVVGFAANALASHALADARLVGRRPQGLSHEAAATLMTVAMTAQYALNHLGRLQPGERVLLHAATGGVGLAALQLARAAGAEIFATAGSPAKRQLLRYLGVDQVMDSRSLSFASDVMEATGGRGVDVILNFLTGDAIRLGMSILAPFGRFIEIGKRDIEANSRLGLRPFQENLSFFAADLDRLCVAKPELAMRLRQEVLSFVESGVLSPLPYRVFSAARVEDAFRLMAKARHVGKIIVAMDGAEDLAPPPEEGLTLRSDATYLVTGGLSGFGLATSQWLAGRGARHLVLMGRSGASSDEAKQAVEALREDGVEVVVEQADVTDTERVREVLSEISRSLQPLRGVVHAAMVLDDAVLANLDAARLRAVLAPKAAGAWNLHRLTLDEPLDFFVLYSSVASLFGNTGQGNYAAANAFLDALSHYRRSRGLPSLTVNWGAIADVGVAARSDAAQEHFARLGVEAIGSDAALAILGQLLRTGESHSAVSPPSDWRRLGQVLPAVSSARFTPMRSGPASSSGDSSESGDGEELVARILAAAPDERYELAQTHLRRVLAGVLGTSPEKLDIERPLADLGIDSLMTVEVVSRLQADVGVEIPPVKFMEGVTLAGLASFVIDELTTASAEPGEPES